jgi:hypothetical protein
MTTQNCFLFTVVLNTQTWRCGIRPTAKVTSDRKYTTSEIKKSFDASTIVFSVIMKRKTVRKQLLNKLQ